MKLVEIKIDGLHDTSMQSYIFNDKLNCIVGPNGSGKSTILQAIQLCLLGYIPGTAKTKTSIMSHSNGNHISIVLRLSDENILDDIVIQRTYVKSGNKIDEECKVSPDCYSLEDILSTTDIPILDFAELLGLSANKKKEQLISMLPDKLVSIETQEYFTSLDTYSDSSETLLTEITSKFDQFKSVQDISDCNKFLKDILSRLNAEEKRLTSTVQSLMFYEDYTGTKDVDLIRSQLNDLMNYRDKIQKIERQLETKKLLEDELSKYDEFKIGDLTSELEKKNDEYLNYKKQQDSINLEIKYFNELKLEFEAKHKIYQQSLDTKNLCPVMHKECTELSQYLRELQQLDSDVLKQLNEINSNLDSLNQKFASIQTCIDTCSVSINNLTKQQTESSHIVQELKQYENIEYPEVSFNEIKIKIDSLHNDLIKASANQQYISMMDKLQTSRFILSENIKFIKEAINCTNENGLQSELAYESFKIFESEVNELIKELNISNFGNFSFSLSTKSNSFDFGLNRNNKFVTFNQLSSGEQCIYLLIFQIVLNKLTNTSMNFILIDDLFDHLDSNNLRTVITNINNICAHIQLIIAGVFNTSEIENNCLINLGDKYDH